jgi:hypothetical protein
VWVLVFVWIGILVTGCARSDMTERDVQTKSEAISGLLLAAADGLPRSQDDFVRSAARKEEIGLSDPWRYWQIRVEIVLADDSPTSPVDVAGEMVRSLQEEGWSEVDRPSPPRVSTRHSSSASPGAIGWW